MNIAPTELGAQYDRASHDWPFIAEVEARHGLPPMLLFAVGSRETNLTDESGDGGHGRGVWQLDDRSHTIPSPFPVAQQAEIAAGMLADNFRRFGSWQGACAAYNSGQPNDADTTGHDYGREVLDRCAWLQRNRRPVSPAPPHPEDPDVLKSRDPKSGAFVLVDPAGAVFAFGPDGAPGGHYLGGLNNHPDWNAGEGKPEGAPVGVNHYDDGRPGLSAYVIVTRDATGAFHRYNFPSDARFAK